MSKEVFILGAGFSKAILNEMPLLNELGKEIKKRIKKDKIFKGIYDKYIDRKFVIVVENKKKKKIENFEEILTYLYQDLPWKTEAEKHLHYALYVRITELIKDILEERSNNEPPAFLEHFLSYLHENKSVVITFNYDTIIEDKSVQFLKPQNFQDSKKTIKYSNLYKGPIRNALSRTKTTWETPVFETFTLLKLHGSINWFYSGNREARGEVIYFLPKKSTPEGSYESIKDLVPLIIPPVLDKSGFMGISAIKIQWEMARQALAEADKIYIIGYSLPLTDMAVKLLLKTTIKREAEVIPVNPDPRVIENLKDILGGQANISAEFVEDGNYEIVKRFINSYLDKH